MPAKTAYHHGNLKPALIAAALKEISREGPDGFSLRGVARRAGVSAPAVYRHFEDKEHLLAAVATECSERMAATVAAAQAKASPHPLAQFRAIGIALVQFAAANPEHFRAISMPGVLGKSPGRSEQDAARIAAGQRAGLIADIPVDDIMLAANALVTGLAHMIVEGQLGPVDDKRATELATAVTGVIGVGLVPRDEVVPGRKKTS